MKLNLPLFAKSALPVLAGIALQTGAVFASGAPDLDGDGIPNVVDTDIDNDGFPNADDDNIDGGIALTGPYAGKKIGDDTPNADPAEDDIDDDGLADDSLAEKDIDGDGKLDNTATEDDIDGDKRPDTSAAEKDIDGDGKADDTDTEDDIDGDGLDDDDTLEADIDGDSVTDTTDVDTDGDGLANASTAELDTDGDSLLDDSPEENDDDGDGVEDINDDDDDNDGTGDLDDGDHTGEQGEEEAEVELARQAAASPGSEAKVKYIQLGSGASRLVIEAADLASGTYDVVVGGVTHGSITSTGLNSEIKLTYQTGATGPKPLPLDFIVAGQTVEISSTDVLTSITTVYFTGTVPTPSTGGNTGGVGHGEILLTAAEGVAAAARAKVELEFGTAGAKEFELSLTGLAVGDYSLVVGDTARGIISIAAGVNGNKGKIKFDLHPETEEGELLLDFAVASQPIAIVQADATLFFGNLPAAPTPPAP